MPTPAEGLGTPSQPLLAIRRGTKGLFPARIVPLCVPVRAPFPLHASVPPSRLVQSSGHLRGVLRVPACAPALRGGRAGAWGAPGRVSSPSPSPSSPPASGDSSQHLGVADGTGGQEPPAGDRTHGARAGHRLVSPQRQRHRQRLGGHHRHGEGLDPGWEGDGGYRGSGTEHPPPPASLPAKCHWPIFSPSAMRSRWRRLLSP